jgi:hypothetical protein
MCFSATPLSLFPDRTGLPDSGQVTELLRAARPGEEGTVRRSASAAGGPVRVFALDEGDSGLEFDSRAAEAGPGVWARPRRPARPRRASRPGRRRGHPIAVRADGWRRAKAPPRRPAGGQHRRHQSIHDPSIDCQ